MNEFKEDTETEEIQSVQQQLNYTRAQLEEQIHTGAVWFFIIAAMSLLNALVSFFGKLEGFSTLFNLQNSNLWDLIFNVILTVIYLGAGIFALRKQTFAFLIGMVVCGVNAFLLAILTLSEDLSLFLFFAFLLIAMFFLFKGIKALYAFQKIGEKGFFETNSI